MTPGYFRALRVPLLEGATSTSTTAPTAARPGGEQSLAQRFFPGQSPSANARFGRREPAGLGGDRRVVGNIKHQRSTRRRSQALPPYSQNPRNFMTSSCALRRPSSLIAPIRTQVAALDPDQPITISTMETLLARTLAQSVRHAVARRLLRAGHGPRRGRDLRRHERVRDPADKDRHSNGARAQQGDVLTRWCRGSAPALRGARLAGSFALTRIIATLLYSVGPTDSGNADPPSPFYSRRRVPLAAGFPRAALPRRSDHHSPRRMKMKRSRSKLYGARRGDATQKRRFTERPTKE